MAPERDWRSLMDLTNRLKRWAKPSRDCQLPHFSAPELFIKVMHELETLADGRFRARRAQLAFRDTLLIGVLICAPIRLRNLAMIRIGAHLEWQRTAWHLRFEASETKTGQLVHLLLSKTLDPHVETYLRRVRPCLPGADHSDHLWISQKGAPMAEITIYNSVIGTSGRLFGNAINPHMFRSIAATFLAETSPEDALCARQLLGHRSMDTTQIHYIKARQIEASRKVAEALREIRDPPPQHP